MTGRILLALMLAAGVATPAAAKDRDTLYQVSTLAALQAGRFQGQESLRNLRRHGDFGLGTFTALNGEMVVDRGTIFQVPFSGRARVAPGGWETPFAAVTFFDADRKLTVRKRVDLDGLGRSIDRRIGSKEIFYAVRVTGRFSYVQTRSVPKQTKPFPPLADVIAEQRTFDLRRVRGTMVGIRSPEFVGTANVPGYHWHFITKNGRAGGHVLAMKGQGLRAAVDATRRWQVELG